MKTHAILLTLAALLLSTAALADGQEGHGGTIIRGDDGREVSADLYFRKRDFKLPDYYRPEPYALDPATLKELEGIDGFLKMKNRREPLEKLGLADFEIYAITRRFSNADVISLPRFRLPRQVAFTLQFTQTGKNYSRPRMRRFIELDAKLFERLDARNRAYVILHEILHHRERGGGHEVVSPFIQSLDTVMKIHAEQVAGRYRTISRAEFDAAESLHNLMTIYSANLAGATIDRGWVGISRAWGGTFYCVENEGCDKGFSDKVDVDVGSTLWIVRTAITGKIQVRRSWISLVDFPLRGNACGDYSFSDVHGPAGFWANINCNGSGGGALKQRPCEGFEPGLPDERLRPCDPDRQ